MPQVLVTGATGALGPTLVRYLLEQGCAVRVMSLSEDGLAELPGEVTIVIGNITDRQAVVQAVAGVEIVFHLAALLHINNPSPALAVEYERVNVTGTQYLVEAAQAASVRRFVFFSTISVYGPSAGSEPFTELSPLKPQTMYAITKADAERLVLAAHGADGQSFGVVLRLAAVYGERIKGNYASLLTAVQNGRFLPIGTGHNRRTLVYDKDVAQAAWLAATHPAASGQVLNVTDGQIHTLHQILAVMRQVCGKTPYRWHLPLSPVSGAARLGEKTVSLLGKNVPLTSLLGKYLEDVAVEGQKIQQLLGFVPQFDLRTGWAETINYRP